MALLQYTYVYMYMYAHKHIHKIIYTFYEISKSYDFNQKTSFALNYTKIL